MQLTDFKRQLKDLVLKFNDCAADIKDSDGMGFSDENSPWFWVQAFSGVSPSVHFEIQECGEEFVLVFHNELHGNSWAKSQYLKKLGEHPELPNKLRRHFVNDKGLCDRFGEMSKVVLDLMKEMPECYPISVVDCKREESDSKITIEHVTAKDILRWNLFIPQYQRGYEWCRRNIFDFLNDIWDWRESHDVHEQYHIGTVVLRLSSQNRWAVIDGQQRLTTLSLLQYALGAGDKNHLMESKDKYLTEDDKNHLAWGCKIIQEWVKQRENQKVDNLFDCVSVSAVKIPSKADREVEFKFFSSINSLGKRLSEYDLIKTHHLRYIQDDKMAEAMAALWNRLEGSKGGSTHSVLLNETLYRLRSWRSGLRPRLDAESAEDRPLYRHYSVEIDPLLGYADSAIPLKFDSILSGGALFFKYVERYHCLYESFDQENMVVKLRAALSGHSWGVLLSGMLPIAFLFYCKFGKLYLNDVLYAIVYRVSELRNEAQVRGSYLRTKDIFQKCVVWLDRATSESVFLAYMLNPKLDYSIVNHGPAATRYWGAVKSFLGELEKCNESLISIPRNLYKASQLEKVV